MSDKKTNKEDEALNTSEADEFASVESVEENTSSYGEKSPKKPSPILDAVIEIAEDDENDDDEVSSLGIIDEEGSDNTSYDGDDFDDLEDDLVATGPSGSSPGKQSGGKGKLVVGALALLSIGAAGYYFMPSGEQKLPVVQAPQIQEIVYSDDAPEVKEVEIIEEAVASDEIVLDEIVDISDKGDSELMIDTNADLGVVSAEEIFSDNLNDIEVTDGVIINQDVIEEIVANKELDNVLIEVTASDRNDSDNMISVNELTEFDEIEILDISEQTADDKDIILLDAPSELTNTMDNSMEVSQITKAPVIRATVPIPTKKEVYFDSVQEVMQRDSTLQSSGPSEVNPIAEPASKYVVVSGVTSKNSVEAKVQQAKRALKLGRYDAAYDFYEHLYNVNPRDQAILMGRAVSLQKLGRKRAAIEAYAELLDIHPKNADALVNMLGLVNNEQPAVALQKLLSLRSTHPNNAGVVAQIALTYASMNNTLDARRYMNIAMGMEPKNAQHPYNLAVIYDRDGSTSNAIKYYEVALSLDAVHAGGRSLNRDTIYDRLIKLR